MPVGAQKIQYCRCKINLAGQNCHTVIFTEYNPVTWPEVQVLMFLHGEENVMEIMPVGIGETWPTVEKNRLATIYGSRPVETCFPGRSFRMDYMMTGDTDLPFYVDGVMAANPDPKPPEDKPAPPPPPPVSPPPDAPGTDHDDGDDDETAAAKAALAADISFSPGSPVFKPGRSKPPSRQPGA